MARSRSEFLVGRTLRMKFIVSFTLLFSNLIGQEVTLAKVFGDHMVLQQGKPIPVWGTATPGSPITISLGQKSIQATSDENGNWRVQFKSKKFSFQPIELTVISKRDTISIQNILVGEVWICAGQSNMEWPLSASAKGAEAIEKSANQGLRLFNLKKGLSTYNVPYLGDDLQKLNPDKFYNGQWKVSSPESATPFSGVGYFFGQDLQKTLNVPVGLINVAVGGSPAEAWIRTEALARHPQLKSMVQGDWFENSALDPWCIERGNENLEQVIAKGQSIPKDEFGFNHPFKPGFLWEAGIKPFTQFPIAGVLWYQGESNAESEWRVDQHTALLTLLIEDWRNQFAQRNLPFLFVQLPGMKRPHWTQFRASQQEVHDTIRNTGMAVTIDVGHPTDVHPNKKQPVGHRLAKIALDQVYGKNTLSQGPALRSKREKYGKLELRFSHVGKGLKTDNGLPPVGFELMDSLGQWVTANAMIINKNKVILSHPNVETPQSVRYGWKPYPDPVLNLFNSAKLPMAPFIDYE